MIEINNFAGCSFQEGGWVESDDERDEQAQQQRPESGGDELIEEKDDNTTRVYFQNLNGIKWDNDGGNWPAIC